MIIRLNGEDYRLEKALTVLGLIDQLGLNSEHLVVELNGDLLDRQLLGDVSLQEHDSIELITFMGGGA